MAEQPMAEPETAEQPAAKVKGRKRPRHYRPSIERLRILLMCCACINLLGFPTVYGGTVQQLCGFAPIAFFILSGYLVLRKSEHRLKRIARTIKRTAIVFAVLVVAYFAVNLFCYRLLGVDVFPAFKSKRFWFNFVVLNVWPFDIGGAIWYVQSLLYAYIILFFLEKWKLMKYDWIIAIVLFVITVVTGEFCGFIRWNLFGYFYIPGNFLTRALPYVLLGGVIHRNMTALAKIRKVFYWIGIPAGVVLAIGEIALLDFLGVPGYYGHLIGFGVTAFSACMLAFRNSSSEIGFEVVLNGKRWWTNLIYYLAQPSAFGVVLLFSTLSQELRNDLMDWAQLIAFCICCGVAYLAAFIEKSVSQKKKQKKE